MGALKPESLRRALQLQGRRLGEILVDENLANATVVAQALKIQAADLKSSASGYVRLPTQLLHTLLEDFEALAEDFSHSSGSHAADADSSDTLELAPGRSSPLNRLQQLKTQFEDLILTPASDVLSKAVHLATDTAKALNKNVSCQVKGGEFDIDIALASELSDMATHLVRNAIVHGIESPADRLKKSKPETGRVTLSLSVYNGALELRVADDGAGLDREKIAQKASKSGVQLQADQLSHEDIRRILFTPGFSTAASLNEWAGRGIGLDVVEAAALRLQGSLDFVSKQGQGLMFKVSLPVSFMRLSVVCLRSGAQWVAIDTAQIRSFSSEQPVDSAKNVYDLSHLFIEGYTASAEDVSAPSKKGVYVHDIWGNTWAADHVTQPQDVFVRGVPTYLSKRYGVCGTTRINGGVVPAVFVDLSALHNKIKSP